MQTETRQLRERAADHFTPHDAILTDSAKPDDVQNGQEADIDAWMALVREMRGNYPGLETQAALDEHRRTVLRFMQEGRALCVKRPDGIAGVLLLSRRHNMICCLGVAPQWRRQGIAAALMTRALSMLDDRRDIVVDTFREGDEKAAAPRALYERFGFEAAERKTENGYPLQRFIRRARKEAGV